MRKNEQGASLILALFLVVALEVLMFGSMMTAMRSQRMSQRSLDRTKNLWAIEAVLDRTNQLFAAYFKAEQKFPNTDANSFVLGNDSQVTGNQTFSDYLAAWYAELKARHSDALNPIQIPAANITIKVTASTATETKYDIQVKAASVSSQESTTIVSSIAGKKAGGGNNLFQFSVFYNDDLEIGPTTDFEVQGPIFANGDIYVTARKYYQKDAQTPIASHPVVFKQAFDINSSENLQKYLIHSAGNFYIGPKRFMGDNYLIQDWPLYQAIAPSRYLSVPGNLELSPDLDLGANPPNYRYPPRFYYATNIFDFKLDVVGGLEQLNPDILVEVAPNSFTNITTSLPEIKMTNVRAHSYYLSASWAKPILWYPFYTRGYDAQPPDSFVSVSSAFDLNEFPTVTTKPLVNPRWGGIGTLLNDSTNGVGTQPLDFGIPSNAAGGLHLLIEPLTGTPSQPTVFAPTSSVFSINKATNTPDQWDTEAVAKAKMHAKADFVLYGAENYLECPTIPLSADLVKWLQNAGIANPTFTDIKNKIMNGIGIFSPESTALMGRLVQDYRMGISNLSVIYLDIRQILAGWPAAKPPPKIIYIAVAYKNQIVVVTNASRLPESGLTIATNGRLWVVGNYNTFSYEKSDSIGNSCRDLSWSEDNSACHLGAADWNDEDCRNNGACRIPPAALVNELFGAAHFTTDLTRVTLSGNYLEKRNDRYDLMVNAALITGIRPSFIEKSVPVPCTFGSCEVYYVYYAPPGYPGEIRPKDGVVHGLTLTNWAKCSGSSPKWQSKATATLGCPFYREEANPGVYHYYVNPKSTFYQTKMNDPSYSSWDLPTCDRNLTLPDGSNDCDRIRIPIFADPIDTSVAVMPIFGVHFVVFNWGVMTLPTNSLTCSDGSTPRYIFDPAVEQSDTASNYAIRVQRPYEYFYLGCEDLSLVQAASIEMPPSEAPRYKIRGYNWVQSGPKHYFGSSIYRNLYSVYYSGGLQNVIDVLQDWQYFGDPKLLYSGSIIVPYYAHVPPPVPSYYSHGFDTVMHSGNSRYLPPKVRKFDFNETLKTNPPPGFSGGNFSVKRERWREI